VQVFEATRQTAAAAERDWKQNCALKTQRTVKDFKNKKIKTSPELEPDPNYKPHFVNFPIEWKNIEVEFTSEQMLKIWDYRGTYGDTDEEVVRTLFFHWYLENRKKHGLRWYNKRQSHA
jgi:hypothetical protein